MAISNQKENATPGLSAMQDTERAVISIAAELAKEAHPDAAGGHPPRLSDKLDDDLAFDSLSRVEFLRRIERELGLSLSESQLFQTATLEDVVRALKPAVSSSQIRKPVQLRIATPIEPVGNPAEAVSLGECLAWHVHRHGDRAHVTLQLEGEEEKSFTYSELNDRSLEIASALRERGIEPGDRVALMLPTSFDYLASFFGVLYSGAVPVPLYPPVRLNQLEDHLQRQTKILENCGAKILISSAELKARAKGLTFLMKSLCPALRQICFSEELKSPTAVEPVKPNPSDLALIQFTSGSTGNPRGVALTHANLLANIRAIGHVIGANANDTFVSWLPLYHDMGLIGAWLGSLYYGARLVLMPPFAFLSRPERWLWAIHHNRATLTTAPNFAYELCLKRIQPEALKGLDLSSLRACFNGAEPVSAATLDAFAKRFGPFGLRIDAMTPVYGLAECSVGLTLPPRPREPLVDVIDRSILQRTGQAAMAEGTNPSLSIVACGQPLPGHEVRVVDGGNHELPERVEGRIQFRGPSATSGYFNNKRGNAALFEGGWLNTGDLGYRAGGDLFVTGRSKDVVIRAGRKIQPHEAEEAVGGIAGIRKGCVAVFGANDKTTGTEKLIVLAETRAEATDEKEKLLRQINALVIDLTGVSPDEVVLAPPHTVLKTSSGKLRRSDCRERYEAGRLRSSRLPAWWQALRLFSFALLSRFTHSSRKIVDYAYSAYAWTIAAAVLLPLWVFVVRAPNHRAARIRVKKGAALLARVARIPLKVTGLEHLPNGPCILVANHASYLDAFVLAAALPPEFVYIAKGEFRKSWLFHPFLKGLGTMYVSRYEKEKGWSEVRNMEQNVQFAGNSLLVFPEGTFTRMPGLLPFHSGAFLAAANTGVPVVPVSITGTREILGAESWWLHRGGRVAIAIGEAINPNFQENADDLWKLALRLRDQARKTILQTTGTPDLSLEKSPF
ncbi:MAG: AMP-binding protein [Bdellovibrionota bacterium]